MAKVQVQVAGGSVQQKEASSLDDLAAQVGAVGYIATVNGNPQSGDYQL